MAPQDRAAGVVLVAIVGLGLALRIPGLTSKGLWRDDAWTALASRVGLGTGFRMGGAAPGFTVIEGIWIRIDQSSSLWAQMAPFLAGLAGIVAIYFLARYWRLARWLALTAAFVVATSPIATQYSNHVKEYSTDFLLACFILWRAEAARRSPATRELRILVVGSAVAVLVSGSVIPVIVGCFAALVLTHWREVGRGLGLGHGSDRLVLRRVSWATGAMAAFLVLAYLVIFRSLSPVLHQYWANDGAFLHRSSVGALWHSLGRALSVVTVGVLAPGGHTDVYGNPYLTAGRIFWPALLLLIVMVVGVSARGRALAPGLTLFAAVMASLVGSIPLATGRTDEVLYPAVILLAALGVAQIVRFGAERFSHLGNGKVIGGIVLAVVVGLFGVFTLSSHSVQHPNGYPVMNIRHVAGFVKSELRPGDSILVDSFTRYPWALYESPDVHIDFGPSWGAGFTVVSDEPNVFISPSEPWERGYAPRLWVAGEAAAGRIWYVGTWFLSRATDPIYNALLAQGWKPQGEFDAGGGFAVLMTGGGTSAQALVRQGVTAMSNGDLSVAQAKFEAAAAKAPSNVNAPYDLGVLYQQHEHNLTLARRSFDRALQVNPTFSPALYDLAIADTKSNPHEAIALYQRLLAVTPDSSDALWNLGLLLVAQNPSDLSAHLYLEHALALDPSLSARTPPGVTP